MSYQDKQIAKLEEQNEIGMLLEGELLRLKMKCKIAEEQLEKALIEEQERIDEMKATILNDIKEGLFPVNVEKLHPLIRNIIPDLLKNPCTKRFNFFMNVLKAGNSTEVFKVYNLLLSGLTEEEVADVSPIFKDFLNKPSNQE
jgi:hypothetical protein